MTIQITETGIALSGSAEDLKHLRVEFDRQHCILLPGLLEPRLSKLIQRRINRSEFYTNVHKNVGVESAMTENPTLDLLHFLVNDHRFFEIIRQITGCNRIGSFLGRVYRMISGLDHHDSWHTDVVDHRMIALSINLSREVYEGGILQIRDRESKRILYEVTNVSFGDGIVFRLASHLEHRLTNIEGTFPKTAFAGWFRSKPSYQPLLRKRLSEARSKLQNERSGRSHKQKLFSRKDAENMEPVTFDNRLKINKEVVYRTVGEDTVLINLDRNFYFSLNPTGSRVWELLAKQEKLAEVFNTLKEEYEVAPDVLQQDVLQVVQELQAVGLVEVISS